MKMEKRQRVVITGMSVVCPLGVTLDELEGSLDARRSGVRPLKHQVDADLGVAYGGEVTCFSGDIEDFGRLDKDRKRAIRKGIKLMCREIQMAVAAAQKALNHADLATGNYDSERFGVAFGCDHVVTLPQEFASGIRTCLNDARQFNFDRWANEGMPKVAPLWLLKYLPNMPASHIAIYNQLRGPNNSLTYREASGNLAMGEAYHVIRRHRAERMLVGATGCNISPLKSLHTRLQTEMAGNSIAPAKMCRPFDLNRSGMVAGEGSAAVVLEAYEAARSRGATVYGEVLGSGSSIAVDINGAARCRLAMANAMSAALRSANLPREHVGHLNAHGIATRQGDVDEANAITDVFEGQAKDLPVVAAKSYFGNLGAASGLVELICSLIAIRRNRLFPVLNYETPDPECPIFAVRDDATPAGRAALSVSCTPQGQASAVVVTDAVGT